MFPTGEAAKLETDTYVAKHGFGHEEWMFNYEWIDGGIKFGHLQPVSPGRARLAGKKIDLLLHAFGPDRRWYHVGGISDVRVLSDAEAERAYSLFQARGWMDEMVEDLKVLDVDPSPLLTAPPSETFNVAFNPGRAYLADPPQVLTEDDPRKPKSNRYILTESRVQNPEGTVHPTKTSLRAVRRAVSETQINLRHTRLQNAVHKRLIHAGYVVEYERGYVDLAIRSSTGDALLELKTHPTVRACIREAIGQLLEYAHGQRGRMIKALVVVGRVKPNEVDVGFLMHLRESYGLPLEYWHFAEGKGESVLDAYPRASAVLKEST